MARRLLSALMLLSLLPFALDAQITYDRLLRAAQEAIPKWKWAPAPQESKELVELKFHPN